MPDKIRLLPDTVASQIAAGEVVNRPASVVKEMMENSVDAGATAITVSYRNGGKELIKVIDDGEGMSPLDARMAFDKHATSKITRIEDVYALHTFGFRGEALASIAAIAHVELTTRRPEDELGTQLVVEGSRFQSQENVVAPVGSQFAVKNLFLKNRPFTYMYCSRLVCLLDEGFPTKPVIFTSDVSVPTSSRLPAACFPTRPTIRCLSPEGWSVYTGASSP